MLRIDRSIPRRASFILIISHKDNQGTLKDIGKDMEGVGTPYEVRRLPLDDVTRTKIHSGVYDLILERGKNGIIEVHIDYYCLVEKLPREEAMMA
ncbi:MAG: hypothetical protein WC619_04940 [Patescibacteria group bacterium]